MRWPSSREDHHDDGVTTTGRNGGQPSLIGPDVRLRPWRADDAAAVFAACQDREIQRWTQVPVPYTTQDAEGFVCGIAPATWDEGGALFAVERSGSGSAIAGARATSSSSVASPEIRGPDPPSE